jgi:diguanylate cyclase (GGDEF)-like protein
METCAKASHRETKPLKVLIIEDHPDQRDLLAIVLQREGYQVATAANGVEALEQLERDNFQIVLSDIMMPKMDGFELIKNIRSNPALKAIYVILITARIQDGDRVRGLDLGADDYITKPFSFSELLARVRVGTRVVKYQRHLEHQTQIDSLTGLYNRRAMEEKFHDEFERAKRYNHALSVLILDIDNFKTINDTYGHHGGDTALIKIAEVLRGKTRQSDFSARFGGEEFVLVLPKPIRKARCKWRPKFMMRSGLQVRKTDRTFTLTVSIGVSSTSEKSYSDWRQMLDAADQALYLAKNRGKDRVEPWVAEKIAEADLPRAHP